MSWFRTHRRLSRPAPLAWAGADASRAAQQRDTAPGALAGLFPAGSTSADPVGLANPTGGKRTLARGCQAADPHALAGTAPAGSSPAAGAAGAADELAALITPLPQATRLLSYRYDEDTRYREKLDRAFELWLAAALAEGAGASGGAELCLELSQGAVSLSYAPAQTLAAQLANGRWVPAAASSASGQWGDEPTPTATSHAPAPAAALAHAALVSGEPERPVWDALLAPGVVEGPVRVRVVVRPLPPARAATQAARLAGAEAALEHRHITRTMGTTARTIKDPAAAALQARLAQERNRLLAADGLARCCLVIEAAQPNDLEAACSLMLGAMARTASDGSPLPPPQRVDLVPAGNAASAASRFHLPTSAGSAEPRSLFAVVDLPRLSRFLEPPTTPVAGLSVENVSVGPAARHPFATSGWDGAAGEPAIELGTLASGVPCRIPIGRLSSHAVVTGMPGMRKSTCTAGIARQLIRAGIRVTVLEPSKCEYQRLLADAAPLRVYGAHEGCAQLGVNPFAVDPGIRPRTWIELVSGCLVSALGMEEQPLPLYLENLVRRLYRKHGIPLDEPARANTDWPTVPEFRDEVEPYVREECPASPEIRANVLAALTLRARALADQPAFRVPTGMLAADILGGNMVVRLADLGDESGAVAGMVLLARLMCASRLLGPRPLHTVVVVEEAHALLQNPVTGEPTRFARLYEQLVAEARSCGIGLATVEQRGSLLPAGVLANSVTRIAFASAHDDDRHAVGRALGLSEHQERLLGSLPPGDAVVATAGSAGTDLVHIAMDAPVGAVWSAV